MPKKNTKIIDEILNEFLNILQFSQSENDKFKAYNKLRRNLIKANMGLIHCLWNEHFIRDTILKDVLEDDEFIAGFFDDELLNKKEGLVNRFKIIRQSFTNKPIAKRVQSHLIEATYCYLYGFNEAAIALCRATLEYALKVRLIRGKDDRIGLETLIDEAINKVYLTENYRDVANRIRKYGNQVMHREPFQFDAMNIINDTREILEILYKPRKA